MVITYDDSFGSCIGNFVYKISGEPLGKLISHCNQNCKFLLERLGSPPNYSFEQTPRPFDL